MVMNSLGFRFDCSGNVVEHYSDGDLVNCNTPTHRDPATFDTMAAWGPNVSYAFLSGRIEDISKGAVPYPSEAHAQPVA